MDQRSRHLAISAALVASTAAVTSSMGSMRLQSNMAMNSRSVGKCRFVRCRNPPPPRGHVGLSMKRGRIRPTHCAAK